MEASTPTTSGPGAVNSGGDAPRPPLNGGRTPQVGAASGVTAATTPHSMMPRLTSRTSSSSTLRRRRRGSASLSPRHSPRVSSAHGVPAVDASLDATLPREYFLQDILTVLRQLRIPRWRKIPQEDYAQVCLERISGALTNCIYKVTYKAHHPLLLRLYGDVENIIDRETELEILTRLSLKNIGPRLLGCFSNGRFEEFLNNSITLSKAHIREPRISRMIARRMKELHRGVSLTAAERAAGPKCWVLIEKWMSLIDDYVSGTTLEEQQALFFLSWEEFKKVVGAYKVWLYAQYGAENVEELLRFCHNDTQYGNLLFYDRSQRMPFEDDDEITALSLNVEEDLSARTESVASVTSVASLGGMAALSLDDAPSASPATVPIVTDINFPYDTRLTVIDFEYAGANLPAYDIANHFSEWMYDYHDAERSCVTDESRFPTRAERINLLNSYVKYVPGANTPSLGPMNKLNLRSPKLGPKTGPHTVEMSPQDLPPRVARLYNETIMWRGACSLFWALWGILSKGAIVEKKTAPGKTREFGPNGDEYTFRELADDEMCESSGAAGVTGAATPAGTTIEEDADLAPGQDSSIDDDFNHLAYSNGKIALALGDLLQFGLLALDEIPPHLQAGIKHLDCDMIFP